MVITPQTNIKLLKVPFEMDNLNQLTFANATAQYNYFNGLTGKLEYEECTYQRKDGYMAIKENADTLQPYNYCMYQNEQYGNKWFYAFITNITYESNKVSYVYIKTDVFQTWQFDIVYKKSFIEREHVNDDTIGLHTVPENLELGEYISCATPTQTSIGNYCYITVGVTKIPWLDPDIVQGHSRYNGVVGGLIYIIFNSVTSFDDFMHLAIGSQELVQCVFMIPTEYMPNPSWLSLPDSGGYYAYVDDTNTAYTLTQINVPVPTTIGTNKTPVNKKLMTYPYRYLLATNNTGIDVVYRYEDFLYFNQSPSGQASFDVKGTVGVGCSIRINPKDFKKVTGANNEEGFNLGKFPVGAWINDIYHNWLRQNGLNIGVTALSATLKLASGTAMLGTGNIAGGASNITNGLNEITNLMVEKERASLTPPHAEGNTNASDIMYATNKLAPTFYHMSIKDEYISIIDNFFSMYGYKVNLLKIPNIFGRANWNYVKTVGCNITGDIPQKDLQELKNMFDNGVTLWHNPSTFLDYSQSNAIL